MREEGQEAHLRLHSPSRTGTSAPRSGIIDFERGVKISGSRFYVLKGWGARLQRALITLHARPAHAEARLRRDLPALHGPPRVPGRAPATCRSSATTCTATRSRTSGSSRPPRSRSPTSTATRSSTARRLPIKHVAFTACFRREQMAAGRDTRGIKRGHQFDKVELVKFVRPETSMDELTALLSDAEDVLKAPRAPLPGGADVHRRPVVLGHGQVRPRSCGRRAAASGWRSAPAPTSATSRRGGRSIRFKDAAAKEKARFVHTLNGSGLALPRTLIGVLETYQRADGKIDVPGGAAPVPRWRRRPGIVVGKARGLTGGDRGDSVTYRNL